LHWCPGLGCGSMYPSETKQKEQIMTIVETTMLNLVTAIEAIALGDLIGELSNRFDLDLSAIGGALANLEDKGLIEVKAGFAFIV